MINIYCDESCHLQFDDSDIMLMGGISCERRYIKELSNKIRDIKQEFGLKRDFEIKWTKVSPAQLEFYKKIVDLFFDSQIDFRCVIATGKKRLNHQAHHQTYDEWYYKMYYLLLSKMLDPTKVYAVYIDIKDTNGGEKVRKLQDILNKSLYSFCDDCLKRVQIVKSDEIELLQMCDLLMGAVGYFNRFMDPLNINSEGRSIAKMQMCQYVQSRAQRPLNQKTPLGDTKFNIFVWEPRE